MDITTLRNLVARREDLDKRLDDKHYQYGDSDHEIAWAKNTESYRRIEKELISFMKYEWPDAFKALKELLERSSCYDENRDFFYSSKFLDEIQTINKNSESSFLVIEESQKGNYFSIKSYSDSTRSFDTGLVLYWSKDSGYIVMDDESNSRNKLLVSNILKYLFGNFDFVIKNGSYNYFNVKK